MAAADAITPSPGHSHVFLGEGHERAERRSWAVIWLCGAMMVLEIVGGLLFGSIALVADGLHMSTHAGALLLAALAYSYARKHATDPRFTFGTGKLGDLAGFTSAIVLAMIALLIGYEAVRRLFAPVPIHFGEAIPIAVLGLARQRRQRLAAERRRPPPSRSRPRARRRGRTRHEDDAHRDRDSGGLVAPERLRGRRAAALPAAAPGAVLPSPADVVDRDAAPDGTAKCSRWSHATTTSNRSRTIPEPHAVHRACADRRRRPILSGRVRRARRTPHGTAAIRDNNMRAAVIHVIADATVSVLVIVGLLLARGFGWLWMDPLAGLIGAVVIASWAYGLVRDTGAILLDMNPDARWPEGPPDHRG